MQHPLMSTHIDSKEILPEGAVQVWMRVSQNHDRQISRDETDHREHRHDWLSDSLVCWQQHLEKRQ